MIFMLQLSTEPARLLLLVICLLNLVSALAWLFSAYGMRVCFRASRYFSLANCLSFVAVLLLIFRDFPANFWTWSLSDALLLSGFFWFYFGLRTLFRQPPLPRWPWLSFIAAIALLWGAQMLLASEKIAALIFSSISLTLLTACTLATYQPMRLLYSQRTAAFVSFPLLMMSVFFLLRLILVLADSPLIVYNMNMTSAAALPQLGFLLVFSLLMNINAFGCALSRLILRIRDLADRDGLTRVWNRRVILELLSQHESRYQLQGIPFGVLVCDLDHFKQINDRYGHQAGDEALLHAIRCFQQVLRDTDIIGRLGGEEFVIILSNTAPTGVQSAAERFCQNLSTQQLQFSALADKIAPQQITVSIGYGSMGDFADVRALLVAADQAMYRAKQNGRNQICAAIAAERT